MPPSDNATQYSPLAPSVEKAYYRKCIELKRRLNEVEAANDEFKVKRVRLDRAIMKMRLERAFLLDQLSKRMEYNVDGSEGSNDEAVATPPPDRPHRDKRRRAQPSTPAQQNPAQPGQPTQPSSQPPEPTQRAPSHNRGSVASPHALGTNGTSNDGREGGTDAAGAESHHALPHGSPYGATTQSGGGSGHMSMEGIERNTREGTNGDSQSHVIRPETANAESNQPGSGATGGVFTSLNQ